MFLTARVCLVVALAAPFAGAAPVPAGRATAEIGLAAARERVLGEWHGGPCEGTITLRADGTYEWTGIGPGGERHAGVWWVKGDPARPTLALACDDADDKNRVGTIAELTVVRFTGPGFDLKDPGATVPMRFSPAKEESGP